jgi:hypothetical protein
MAISAAEAFNKYCDEIKSRKRRLPKISDDPILDTLFLWGRSMNKKHYYVRHLVTHKW